MKFMVLPGDGIGPEIVRATVTALRALNDAHGLGLELEEAEIGLAALKTQGTTVPDDVVERAFAAAGVLLGPVSTEHYPPASEGGINASAFFRTRMDLYCNMRPSRTLPGLPSRAGTMDLVVMRENTEGFYADRNMAAGSGEFMPTPDIAMAVGKVTRQGCERIARASFELAMRRDRRVTAVHKVNVFKMYSGLFLEAVRDVGKDYPDVAVDTVIVDAMAALLVRSPERFDVICTTNMFGDILSDEAAELAGGLGLAGSLNFGDRHAVAQAAHGSAPDIEGQDIANPAAFMWSTAMLLQHLGGTRQRRDLAEAGAALSSAVDRLLGDPATRTKDLGGALGTQAFGAAVAKAVRGT
jgi:isocitrate/isopropylmalate dehydrogenase